MAEIVRMPSVMAGATHAVLAAWLIEPGAQIAIGEPLAEIETDKAVVEYAAEIAGTVGRFLVQPGANVAVGDPIAVVLAAGEAASALLLHEDVGPAALEPDGPASAPTPPSSPPLHPHPAGPRDNTAPKPANAPGPQGRRFVSPIAKRVAAERNVDLSQVTGTGPNGRIVRRDVDAYAARPDAGPATTRVPVPASPATFTDVTLTGMRRAIARRLTESKATVPHFYVTAHVRADRLLALRQEVNSGTSPKVSVNDFVVKAVATAMVDVPAANAIWNGDSIRYFERVDVGVAIAVPGGLLTPVVRGASSLKLADMSAQIAELADRARSGRLRQPELEGGSFAVSNLGMYGVEEFAAILNPPQAGIVAVSAAKPQPVVGDDGQLAVGTVMTVTLSADHRVIDGTVAAEWITAFVSRLEQPVSLLM